jgi:signal transduction histidine kinase/ligand-binding sensor domain-containing protein
LTNFKKHILIFCKEQRLLILLLFALFHSVRIYAQKLPVKIYKQIDDVDLNGVSSVIQDERQLLWLGTSNGLYWYDGNTLSKPYNNILPESLNITSIIKHKDSSIYVCSLFHGLFKFKNNKFIKINNFSINSKIAVNQIIYLNKNSTIAADDYNLFEIKNEKLTPIKISNFFLHDKINQIEALNDTCFALLLSDTKKIGLVSKKYNQFSIKFYNIGNGFEKITNFSKSLWCSKSNQLFKYNSIEDLVCGKLQRRFKTDKEITNFFVENQNKVWINHAEALTLIVNDSLISISGKSGLSSNLESFCLDNDGNTWFASGVDGLIKLMPQQYEFSDFTEKGYNEVFISGFKITNSKSIFCTFNSILIQEKDRILNVKAIDGVAIEFPSVIGKDRNENILISDINGIILFQKNKLKRICKLEVQSSLLNNDKEILFVSDGYLIRYQNGELDTLKLRKRIQDYVSTMLYDSKNRLWIGMKNGGIQILDKKLKAISEKIEKTHYRMRSLFEDSYGNIYLGTRNDGLYYCNKTDLNQNLFSPIKVEDIGGVWIKKIDQLNDSTILICHEKGLDLLSCKSSKKVIEHIKFYREETLIEPFGMSDMGAYFMVAARKGYFKFDANYILSKKQAPKVFLKRIYVNGELDKSFAAYGHQVTTPSYKYTQNNFKFEFVAVSFKDRSNINYRYRLIGSDTNWLEAKAVNELYFANISPGIYKLEVIADEGNIVIGALPAVYKFEILAPFYQTLWFRFLILLLLFLVIYSSFVYVIKRNLKEKILILEKEQALEKERNRISQDMHDDLGSGLTKIAILSEVTKNEIKDPEKAKKHLENISQSSRHLVESLQNIIWILNTSSEGVEDFFSYTHEYALKYLENSNINLIYEIDTSLYKKNNLSQEVRRNIFLVIKEVLNNAVKHADCSEIVFKAKKNFDSLQLTIEDNGKGFNFNQIRKNANGLKSMKDRILKINGTIEYLKNEHQGHKIVIEIPTIFHTKM